MTFRNRVTEQHILPDDFWVVSAEWKGGHDKRRIQLENIHLKEVDAERDWLRLDPSLRAETDFVRHPIRHFHAIKHTLETRDD